MSHRPLPRTAIACLAVLALAGCATQQQILEGQEGMLAAAGFVARPANTPERQQMLAGLPPGRIVSHPEGDHLSYLFADPLDCRCLYVGGPQEWTRYQQTLQQQRIANAQVEAAQLNYGAFGWGPWGGGFGPGFY